MRYFITLVMTYAIRCKLRKSPLSQNKQIFFIKNEESHRNISGYALAMVFIS